MIRTTEDAEKAFGTLLVTVVSLSGNNRVDSRDIAACKFLVKAVDRYLLTEPNTIIITKRIDPTEVKLEQTIQEFRNFRNAARIVGLAGERKMELLGELNMALDHLNHNAYVMGRHFWLLNELIRDIA